MASHVLPPMVAENFIKVKSIIDYGKTPHKIE